MLTFCHRHPASPFRDAADDVAYTPSPSEASSSECTDDQLGWQSSTKRENPSPRCGVSFYESETHARFDYLPPEDVERSLLASCQSIEEAPLPQPPYYLPFDYPSHYSPSSPISPPFSAPPFPPVFSALPSQYQHFSRVEPTSAYPSPELSPTSLASFPFHFSPPPPPHHSSARWPAHRSATPRTARPPPRRPPSPTSNRVLRSRTRNRLSESSFRQVPPGECSRSCRTDGSWHAPRRRGSIRTSRGKRGRDLTSRSRARLACRGKGKKWGRVL